MLSLSPARTGAVAGRCSKWQCAVGQSSLSPGGGGWLSEPTDQGLNPGLGPGPGDWRLKFQKGPLPFRNLSFLSCEAGGFWVWGLLL